MENGNTVAETPVSINPVPTEADMTRLREIFQHALDAIVQASALNGMVVELKANLDQLKTEVDRVRQNNVYLDEALQTVRTERDNLKVEKHNLEAGHAELDRSLQLTTAELTESITQVHELQGQVERLKRERDDYGFEAMQAKDELTKATTRIDEIKSRFAGLFPDEPKPEPPKPEPVQVPEHIVQPAPDPTYQPWTLPTEPTPTPPPVQDAKPTEDTRPWWQRHDEEREANERKLNEANKINY